MRIAVSGTDLTLIEPNVFTAFDIAAAPNADTGTPDVPTVLEALGERGRPCDADGHVFISIEAVRTLAGESLGGAPDAGWNDQFDAMIAYAAKNEWISSDGTMIKAHLEPLEKAT